MEYLLLVYLNLPSILTILLSIFWQIVWFQAAWGIFHKKNCFKWKQPCNFKYNGKWVWTEVLQWFVISMFIPYLFLNTLFKKRTKLSKCIFDTTSKIFLGNNIYRNVEKIKNIFLVTFTRLRNLFCKSQNLFCNSYGVR